ncbi:MAG: transposase, partial [Deltaproteobacteria bacterium]|nr:transposase [Candidatus Tharpellaceae bacterium]
EWLQLYCEQHAVQIQAYCLMTNHIHIVATPDTAEGLQKVFKPLHMRYAQRINRLKGWKGHLWQGRFFSSPLDDQYLWSAIRYVERNPVRAGMVEKAEDYLWSSASAHCGLKEDDILGKKEDWGNMLVSTDDWSGWLAVKEDSERLDALRKHVEKGLPCGSESFVKALGDQIGRVLELRFQGRPSKQ